MFTRALHFISTLTLAVVPSVLAADAPRWDIHLQDGTDLIQARIILISPTTVTIVHAGGARTVPRSYVAAADLERAKAELPLDRVQPEARPAPASVSRTLTRYQQSPASAIESDARKTPPPVVQVAAGSAPQSTAITPPRRADASTWPTVLVILSVGVVVTLVARVGWRRQQAMLEQEYSKLLAAYTNTFGWTESGQQYLRSVGPSSALRLRDGNQLAVQHGLGSGAAAWGLGGASAGSSLLAGLLGAAVSAIGTMFSTAGINREKTEEQVRAEKAIAQVIADYNTSRNTYHWVVMASWLAVVLFALVLLMASV